MTMDASKVERQEDQRIDTIDLVLGGELEGKSIKRPKTLVLALRLDPYTSPVLQ
jgi:hypothetical protein